MTTADPGTSDMPGRHGAITADVPALVSSIGASPIVVSAACGWPVPPCDVASGRQTPAASSITSWTQRHPCGDVDAEVLRWIASHVKGKKRFGGSLMAIALLLTGASVAPATSSLTMGLNLLA